MNGMIRRQGLSRVLLGSMLPWCAIMFALEAGVQAQKAGSPAVLATTATPPSGTVPQPRSMSGLPLQVGDLPPGVVAVRVIRGDFANNVANHPVELRVAPGTSAGTSLTAATGLDGRAIFTGVTVGQQLQAAVVLDGERLESQRFEVPSLGGVRLVLVGGSGSSIGIPSSEAPTVLSSEAAAPDTWSTGAKVMFVLAMWIVSAVALFIFGRRWPARKIDAARRV